MSDFKIGGADNFLSSIASKVEMSRMQQGAPKLDDIKGDYSKAEEAATQFESILVQQMVKSMWKAVPKGGLLTGSSEEELYQEMLQRELSDNIAQGQSLGIKDMVMEELKKRGEF